MAVCLVLVMTCLVGRPPAGSASRETYRCHGEVATIVGTSANDRLIGTDGPDVIVARRGNDSVDGGKGDDLICGGRGEDVLYGGEGDDVVLGQEDGYQFGGCYG